MRTKFRTGYLSVFLVMMVSCISQKVEPPAPLLPIPSQAQLNWHEMEMNAFVHFTTNTFTGLEWGMGNESPSVFNPEQLDANQWVSVLKDAGFKGLILTCKHHDGFCLWPSKYTEHSVKNSPYKDGKGDVVREVSEACKKGGLKFGVYLSPWDRNRADYGKPSYITYYRNQLKELFTNYGPIFEMWFDGANGGTGYYGGANERRTIDGATYYDWPATLSMVREMQPDVIFFSDAGPGARWCGNEQGYVDETCWATITPDSIYPGKPGITEILATGSENGTQWIPAEVDVSIRPGWFYHENEDSLVKTPEQLFEIYLTSVGRGALLLLNVPPDKRGLINENDINTLTGFKAILDSAFNNDLAKNSTIKASSYRGKSNMYQAKNLIDGNKETFWATDDGITSAYIDIRLNKVRTINYVVLQEYIKLGQRVKKSSIEAFVNGNWKPVADVTTIGYKRIIRIDPVQTDLLRINIKDAKACPVLSGIEIY